MINPPDPNGSLICASRLQTLQKCEETEIRWSKTSHSFSETNLDPARLPFIRWSCWCFWILTILKFTVRTFLPLSARVQVVTSFMTTSHPGQRKRLCRWTTTILSCVIGRHDLSFSRIVSNHIPTWPNSSHIHWILWILCHSETGAASIEPWTSFANTRWALERLLVDAGLGGLEKHLMSCTSMQLGQTHGRSATHGAYIPLSFRFFLRTISPGRWW